MDIELDLIRLECFYSAPDCVMELTRHIFGPLSLIAQNGIMIFKRSNRTGRIWIELILKDEFF